MKNILKFSLLSALLCTINLLSNNGYSMDDDDNYSLLNNNNINNNSNITNSNNKEIKTDTGEMNNDEKQFLKRIDEIINSAISCDSNNAPTISDIDLLSEYLSKEDKIKMNEITTKYKYSLIEYKSICNFILIKKLRKTQNKLNEAQQKLKELKSDLNKSVNKLNNI